MLRWRVRPSSSTDTGAQASDVGAASVGREGRLPVRAKAASRGAAQRFWSRTSVAMVALAFLLMAGILTSTWLLLHEDRRQIDDTFAQEGALAVRMFEEFATSTVMDAQLSIEALQLRGSESIEIAPIEIDLFRVMLRQAPAVRAFAQVRPDGQVISASNARMIGQYVPAPVMVGLREGFGDVRMSRWMSGRDLAQADGPHNEPGDLGFIAVSRPIGEHIVAAIINPDTLLNYLEQHLSVRQREAMLLRSDGALLARQDAPGAEGPKVSLKELREVLRTKDLSGGLDYAIAQVGEFKVMYRASRHLPVVAVVVIDQQRAHEQWLHEAVPVSAIALLAAMMVMGLSALLIHALRRNEQALVEIGEAHVALEARHRLVHLQREELQANVAQLEHQQSELIEARDAARAANEAKSQFIANISHELRTPLNGVLTVADLMMSTRLTPEQREFVAMQQESGKSLLTLINDLLDFAKVESGNMSFEQVDFPLAQTVQHAIGALMVAARSKGLQCEMQLAPDLPSHVRGDATRLRQIAVNLMGNALKFTERGRIDIQLRRGVGDAIVLAVADTGIGIAKEHQHKIFEAFTQADASTTRRFGGTGLGLTIVRRLVELQGGALTLDSEVGQGSRFEVTLNLPQVHVQPARPEQAISISLAGLRVLVAEDHRVNQQLVRSMLKRWQAEVVVADNGKIALDQWLDALQQQAFDLVLMDMQMPVLDGLEATREIRDYEEQQQLRNCPILALTANVTERDRRLCAESGMDGFVGKPIDARELAHEIARVLPQALLDRSPQPDPRGVETEAVA